MMRIGLMLERTAADEFFISAASEMPSRSKGIAREDRPARNADCERLAAMPMPELLYYVLVGEGEIADGLA